MTLPTIPPTRTQSIGDCWQNSYFCLLHCQKSNFPSVKSSKIFKAHRTQRDTNFKPKKVKKVGFVKAVFSIFTNWSFIAAKKLVL